MIELFAIGILVVAIIFLIKYFAADTVMEQPKPDTISKTETLKEMSAKYKKGRIPKEQAEATRRAISSMEAENKTRIEAARKIEEKNAADAILKAEERARAVPIRIDYLITQHIKTLAIKKFQANNQDDYGNINHDKWDREIEYFIENVLCKDSLISQHLNEKTDGALSQKTAAIWSKEIKDAVEEYQHNRSQSITSIDDLDPIEFEHYCADILRNDGWNAHVTQASGDQGVDVIATMGNIKAVFQCKKYSSTIGNGAVQEIIAGKQFEQADIAAVVSNASFTPSARQLASSTNVYLLHYSELRGFAEKLSLVSPL